MIYLSSLCIRKKYIKDSITVLNDNGFKQIELTAGTNYYKGIEEDLVLLKNKFYLTYILHNYFPPSPRPFVLNLASLNDHIYNKSLAQLRQSIRFSKRMKIRKFGFHAGYFIDFKNNELGRVLKPKKIYNRDKCLKRFCNGFNNLKKFVADSGIELYLENNVISNINLKVFRGINPFMMTNYEEYKELKSRIDFKLLLDIAHLRVSCNSLRLNFEYELGKLIKVSDYLHLSGSDGNLDQNRNLSENSYLLTCLKKHSLTNKILVLEIYVSLEKIKESYFLLKEALNVE